MSNIRYRPKRRYRSFKARKTNTYTKGFLIILGIGVFMYVFIAGATGKWVADNIVLPVISIVSGDEQKDTTSDTSSDSEQEGKQEEDSTLVSETITVDTVSSYLLQLGAFSKSTNAESEAISARSRGAAGFILEGDGYFRVIASAYDTVEDLQSVQEQLKESEDIETGSFLLESQELELKVSGAQSQLDALKQAFNTIKSLRETLHDLVVEFDKQNITQASCLDTLKTKANLMDDAKKAINDDAKNNTVVASLVELMTKLSGHIEEMESQDTVAEFSAQLKYAQIYTLNAYHQFIEKLAE